MGDRTTVTLNVLNRHLGRVQQLDDVGGDILDQTEEVTTLIFYEINYGDLDFYRGKGEKGFLEKLRDEKIPYDVEWAPGCEYPAGGDYFRVLPDGTTSLTEVPCLDQADTVSIADIESILDSPQHDNEIIRDITALVESVKKRDNPPFTLVENREYV